VVVCASSSEVKVVTVSENISRRLFCLQSYKLSDQLFLIVHTILYVVVVVTLVI
jgi:hypothetical protein